MNLDLKCLRCNGTMQLGHIQHRDQLYPAVWSLGSHKEPGSGVQFISKAEAGARKQAQAEMAHSRSYVDAYRCAECGYTELSSTRQVNA